MSKTSPEVPDDNAENLASEGTLERTLSNGVAEIFGICKEEPGFDEKIAELIGIIINEGIDLLNTTEVAQIAGISRQRVSQLMSTPNPKIELPKPIGWSGKNTDHPRPHWLKEQIQEYVLQRRAQQMGRIATTE